MATKAGNGILESEIVRGILIPLPEFQLEYAVEAELHIEFALMLPKKRGEKTQSEIADKLNIFISVITITENPEKTNPALRIAKLQKIFGYRFVSF